ncbi:S4 domain-containing protein [Succinivibrio dextrinosolvens]|uniref:23S rRNA pseudouridine(2605) synthase RluB n=1 Tax=Succinivibrio dextrinosolvens TaxID=83771 RepID=UPI0008F2DF2E|nr:23S rRNA pseudouridine(2605) synthase RluB [Succinivibrio dextrinosolvens]SFS83845.1 S4 domain-containing protein [Succinivibrio dextrinosolvens]
MTEKLQKILSRAGIASRRALEQMIDEGRVTVDGKIASIGDRFEANEITVKIDNKVVLSPSSNKVECRVLMYHKPEGELTTLSDPENRPTVFDHIPQPPSGRWIYIGRLDINTSGLLLFTTDGELANALMHPKYEVERVYAARIYGEVSEKQISDLLQGVTLEDGVARFSKIMYQGGEGRNSWYHVTLKEGRKREVRRLWEAVGLKVSRLIRIKYAGISLDPNIKTGQFRELTLSEINKLRKTVHLEPIEEAVPSMELNAAQSTKSKKAAASGQSKTSEGRKPRAASRTVRGSEQKSAPRKFDKTGEGRKYPYSKKTSDNSRSSSKSGKSPYGKASSGKGRKSFSSGESRSIHESKIVSRSSYSARRDDRNSSGRRLSKFSAVKSRGTVKSSFGRKK